VDEAQGHGPGKREHVAAAELGELLDHRKLLDDLAHLDPEGGIDDRHQRAPHHERQAHHDQPQAVLAQRVAEDGAVHATLTSSSA
jgi:hypothetical protein